MGGRNGAGLSRALYAEIPPVIHLVPLDLKTTGSHTLLHVADQFRGILRMHEFRVIGHMDANADRIGNEISGYSGNEIEKEKNLEISRLVSAVKETQCH